MVPMLACCFSVLFISSTRHHSGELKQLTPNLYAGPMLKKPARSEAGFQNRGASDYSLLVLPPHTECFNSPGSCRLRFRAIRHRAPAGRQDRAFFQRAGLRISSSRRQVFLVATLGAFFEPERVLVLLVSYHIPFIIRLVRRRLECTEDDVVECIQETFKGAFVPAVRGVFGVLSALRWLLYGVAAGQAMGEAFKYARCNRAVSAALALTATVARWEEVLTTVQLNELQRRLGPDRYTHDLANAPSRLIDRALGEGVLERDDLLSQREKAEQE